MSCSLSKLFWRDLSGISDTTKCAIDVKLLLIYPSLPVNLFSNVLSDFFRLKAGHKHQSSLLSSF